MRLAKFIEDSAVGTLLSAHKDYNVMILCKLNEAGVPLSHLAADGVVDG